MSGELWGRAPSRRMAPVTVPNGNALIASRLPGTFVGAMPMGDLRDAWAGR